MSISALIATFGSFIILVQAGVVPTPLPLPEGCRIPCMDGVFVLDVSLSIKNDDNFDLMKDFITRTFPVVNISQECSHAAVILFAADATIRFDLNEYTDQASLTNAVNEIVYSEIPETTRTGTNTPAALDLMRTAGQSSMLGLRDDVIHIGVFITDGRPNLKHLDEGIDQKEANRRTEVAGNRLHEAEIYDQIYAIGIEGNKPLGQTLEFIADPESLVFPIAGFDEGLLMELGRNISLTFCNPCLLRPCPPGSKCRICEKTDEPYCVNSCACDNGGCPEGQRCVEVANQHCSPGQCCSPVNVSCSVCDLGRVDCVFVLDNSLSIASDTNFGLIRNLVTQMIQQLTIGLENSLVSVMIFARHASINFTLTEHTTTDDLVNAINQISYFDLPQMNRTGTNIPDALQLLRTGGQDGSIGLRSTANFTHAIFITDGRANTIHLQEEITGERLRGDARKNQLRIDEANSIEAAERLHDSDVYDEVFAIGIRGTHEINLDELHAIASRPQFVFEIEDFTEEAFRNVTLQLTAGICDPCTGFDCPPGSTCKVCEETGTAYCEFSCTIDNGGCPEGSTCLEAPVSCLPGQCCSPIINCEACELITDFVFITDVSLSIGSDRNYDVVKNFINSIGNFLEISPRANLVGQILFARHANVNFSVQEHTNEDALTQAVEDIVWSKIPALNRTGTNIPEALDLLRTAGRSDGELRLRYNDSVAKVAVFITDGRPNTKDLNGDSNKVAAQKTKDAAARLRESGIYDQIYAIGIRGNKDIKFEELEFIASDPSLVFIVQDFDAELFEELQRNLTNIICAEQECPVEGQIFSQCASCVGNQPNCSDPIPACTQECQPGCTCPAGTVIDEIQNRCVPLSRCTCPPQCSHEYCSAASGNYSLTPCMRGAPPYTEADCKDACQLTYCEACYYHPDPDPLPPPPGCVDPSTDDDNCNGCICCLKEWARCVEPRNERDNSCTGDCQTAGNFKCYAYPPCDA